MRRLTAVTALLAGLGIAGCGAGAAPSGSSAAGATAAGVAMAGATAAGAAAARASSAAGASAGTPASSQAPGKRAGLLDGVSCARQQCVAVGSYYSGSGTARSLTEQWTGSAWRLEPSPAGSLQAVSCAAGDRCLAVGSPVIAWNGGRWQIVRPASKLDAVSCPAAGSCLAVGSKGRVPVYATWAGPAWHTGTMRPPPRQAQSVTVAGVWCTSSADCLAVGDYSYGATAQPTSSYRDQILAEQWNGHSWRLLPAVNVGPVDQLTAVSCAAPGDCTAVGTFARQYPLAERWTGKAWQAEPVPAPGTVGYTELTAVSCPSAVSCVAVGTYQGVPVAESWNGRAWKAEWLPEPPADNHSAQLNGVSCTGDGACVAVGVDGNGLSYAERYNGGRWQLSATPSPE